MESATFPADSKLEFISGYEKKPLYQNLDVGYPITKIPCTAKRSFLAIMAILVIIFIIALTASLARSSCRCRSPEYGSFIGGDTGGSYGEIVDSQFDDVPFPWDKFRLPQTVIPYNYRIQIRPDWHPSKPEERPVKTFRGDVLIYMDVNHSTDSIVLNAKDLKLKKYTLHELTHDGALGTEVEIKRVVLDNVRLEMVYFGLGTSLRQGQKLVFNISYQGSVKTLNGLYASSYTDSKDTKHHLLSTQFEPNYARQAFPSFDEPSFKAVFQISLVRPQHLKSLSNMPLLTTQAYTSGTNDGSRVKLFKDIFEPSVVMSSYLVAFVICDFDFVTDKTGSGTLVKVHTPPEQIDQAKFALKVAVDALNFYEDFFAIPFPLPKMDLIAIPDFSVGAMENWGLVTYRMVDLLYKPNVTSESAKQRVAIVVAHELAHQWFGNLVTMAWWNDLWLNEGFASYMEYVCVDHIFKDWEILQQFPYETASAAFSLDALKASHPVSHDIEDPNSIQAMFDTISYNKGALLLRMLDGPVMPRTSFRRGLQKYLKKYAYQNAKSEDLWLALQDVWNEDRFQASQPLTLSSIDLNSFMSGWINQKGFPLVTVSDPQASAGGEPALQIYQAKFGSQYGSASPSHHPDKRTLRRSYERNERALVDLPSTPGPEPPYTWQIPFTMFVGQGSNDPKSTRTESVWLKNGNATQTVSPLKPNSLWVKGNVDYAGYYMVNYGKSELENLIAMLKTNPNSLPAVDKVQLIQNSFFLDRFGYTNFLDTLKVLTYVNPTAFDGNKKPLQLAYKGLVEKEELPLMSMLDVLHSTRHKFIQDDEAYKTLWPNFINKLALDSLLEIYDWRTDLSHLKSLFQSTVISMAVALGHEETINRARPLFKRMIYEHSNDKDYLPYPGLTSAILTAGIKYGNTEDWEAAWKAYRSSNVPSEKVAILNALGSSRDPALISKLLEYTLTPDYIRPQDTVIVLSRVASNPFGSALTWNFLRSQWSVMEERFGDSSSALSNLVKGVVRYFQTPKLAAEFEEFATSRLASLPPLSLNQTRENIALNIAWLAANQDAVKAWLKEHQ